MKSFVTELKIHDIKLMKISDWKIQIGFVLIISSLPASSTNE